MRRDSGSPTRGVCLERGPAFRLARKNFPHGRPRLSSEGPERTRRTRGSGLTAVADRARGERRSERSESLQGFARILTNGRESLPNPCGLRPRQVFLRHTCRAGSLLYNSSILEGCAGEPWRPHDVQPVTCRRCGSLSIVAVLLAKWQRRSRWIDRSRPKGIAVRSTWACQSAMRRSGARPFGQPTAVVVGWTCDYACRQDQRIGTLSASRYGRDSPRREAHG